MNSKKDISEPIKNSNNKIKIIQYGTCLKRIKNFSQKLYKKSLSTDFYQKIYNYDRHIANFYDKTQAQEETLRNMQIFISLILSQNCNRYFFFKAIEKSIVFYYFMCNNIYNSLDSLVTDEKEVILVDELYAMYKQEIKSK